MILTELKKILDLTGLPVTYSQWTATPDNPVPMPPYICYLVDGSSNMIADNKVYQKINDVNIELYTTKKTWLQKPNLKKS